MWAVSPVIAVSAWMKAVLNARNVAPEIEPDFSVEAPISRPCLTSP